jgi:hypothetical protein
MTFQWASSQDEDLARTFSSAIKYRDGFFASFAQAKFLNRLPAGFLPCGPFAIIKAHMKAAFGVDVEPDQTVVQIEGMSNFGSYGVKGLRPSTWIYIIDNLGVVAKYKLKYVGDMRSGTRPDPKKTVLEWTRTVTTEPAWNSKEEQQKREAIERAIKVAEERKDWIAPVGMKLTNLKVKFVKLLDGGPGQWGYNWTSIFETEDGNTIFWHGVPQVKVGDEFNRVEEGTELLITVLTVKKHVSTKKGTPATVINRPKFQLVM